MVASIKVPHKCEESLNTQNLLKGQMLSWVEHLESQHS